jgi:hypothetical protein
MDPDMIIQWHYSAGLSLTKSNKNWFKGKMTPKLEPRGNSRLGPPHREKMTIKSERQYSRRHDIAKWNRRGSLAYV